MGHGPARRAVQPRVPARRTGQPRVPARRVDQLRDPARPLDHQPASVRGLVRLVSVRDLPKVSFKTSSICQARAAPARERVRLWGIGRLHGPPQVIDRRHGLLREIGLARAPPQEIVPRHGRLREIAPTRDLLQAIALPRYPHVPGAQLDPARVRRATRPLGMTEVLYTITEAKRSVATPAYTPDTLSAPTGTVGTRTCVTDAGVAGGSITVPGVTGGGPPFGLGSPDGLPTHGHSRSTTTTAETSTMRTTRSTWTDKRSVPLRSTPNRWPRSPTPCPRISRRT